MIKQSVTNAKERNKKKGEDHVEDGESM